MSVALVTGPTAGIGRSFAHQLAEQGYDLVLVARDKARLDAEADELRSAYGVSVEVLPADLVDRAELATVEARLADRERPVDLLVNNAGFGFRGRFLELDPVREAEMVRVNCEAVVTLTHAFVPGMVERGRGGVITVASTAGMQPLPYEVTYGASKAFAISFMEALWMELRGTGVRVTVVNPGPVKTEWQGVAGYDESTPIPPGMITAEQCVSDALRAYDRNKRSVITGRFFPWFMRAAVGPKGVKLRVAERMYRPRS
jgi:uncharacterized protein